MHIFVASLTIHWSACAGTAFKLSISASVVIYAATRATFKPKLEKIKNSAPKKNLIFQEMELSNFQNLIKLFHTLNKTPLGKIEYLSNLYYLLTAQASSFLIQFW